MTLHQGTYYYDELCETQSENTVSLMLRDIVFCALFASLDAQLVIMHNFNFEIYLMSTHKDPLICMLECPWSPWESPSGNLVDSELSPSLVSESSPNCANHDLFGIKKLASSWMTVTQLSWIMENRVYLVLLSASFNNSFFEGRPIIGTQELLGTSLVGFLARAPVKMFIIFLLWRT